MDVALVRFVGAGITSVATGLGVQVPQGAIEGGYNLVSYLLANNPDRTRGLIEGAVRELWADWKRSGLPPKVASTHLEALPTIMDRHRPADDRFVGALAVAKMASRSGPAAVMGPSRRIASSIVTAARDSQLMPADVSDAIALFFLERLYCHLLMERNVLLELGPTLDAYFYKSLWRGKSYDPAVIMAASVPTDAPAATPAGALSAADASATRAVKPIAAQPVAGQLPAPAAAERAPFGAPAKRPSMGSGGAAEPAREAVREMPAKTLLKAEPADQIVEAALPASVVPVGPPPRPGQPKFREPITPPNAVPRPPRLRGPAAEPPSTPPASRPEGVTPPGEADTSADATPAVQPVVPAASRAAASEAVAELDIASPIAAALVAAEHEPEPPFEPAVEPAGFTAATDPPAFSSSSPVAASQLPLAAAEGMAWDETPQAAAPGPIDELENDPLVLDIAARTGAPARVVAALADDLMASGDKGPLDEDQLVAACATAAMLLETLSSGGNRAPAAQVHRIDASLAMIEGNLDGTDRALAMAEDEELKAAQRDINVARGHLSQASATRAVRAQLARLRGDLRGAARHYAVAARCLSPLDRAGRWDVLWSQTKVLVELAHERDGAPVLLEAVDTLRQAVGVIGPHEAALEWAQAQKRIAELLLEAQIADGQRSHAVEAIEHVDHAINVLSRARATDSWADAQVLKAIALRRLALSEEGRHSLDQAVEALRSALGPLSASRTPVAQAKALVNLGLALKSLGDRAEDTGAYVEAITQLRSVADIDPAVLRSAGFDAGEIAVATAGAIEALSGARRDVDLLTGAVAELRRAAQLMALADRQTLAEVEEKLAGALERLGRHRRDPAMLQEAARVKLSAHDRHEQSGFRQIADRLRGELEALHDQLARLMAEPTGKTHAYARAG